MHNGNFSPGFLDVPNLITDLFLVKLICVFIRTEEIPLSCFKILIYFVAIFLKK